MLLYGNSAAPHTFEDAAGLLAQGGGYSFLALGFGAWILLCAQSEGQQTWTQRILRSRSLGTIGLYSYGIYVFHVPILGFMGMYLYEPIALRGDVFVYGAWSSIAYLLCATLLTFLFSALSYELFERKILGYKRFFEPRAAVQAQVEAPNPEPGPASEGE